MTPAQFVINKMVKYEVKKQYLNILNNNFITEYKKLMLNPISRKMMHIHIESMNDAQMLKFMNKVYTTHPELDEEVLDVVDNQFEVNLSQFQSYICHFWE